MATSPGTVPQTLASLPHVVVLGGGFAGVATAKGLAGRDVRVTIIDQHNFHTFQPLLYQVATAGLEPADVAFPIRTIFGHARNVRFRHGRVRSVDQVRNVVTLGDGSEIPYDHLVIATGATVAYFGIPGASQVAVALYTLGGARSGKSPRSEARVSTRSPHSPSWSWAADRRVSRRRARCRS